MHFPVYFALLVLYLHRRLLCRTYRRTPFNVENTAKCKIYKTCTSFFLFSFFVSTFRTDGEYVRTSAYFSLSLSLSLSSSLNVSGAYRSVEYNSVLIFQERKVKSILKMGSYAPFKFEYRKPPYSCSCCVDATRVFRKPAVNLSLFPTVSP